MQTTLRHPHIFDAYLFRWLARTSALVLLAAWIAFVIGEAVMTHFEAPSLTTYYQAAALAIVFAGYAVGWRKEWAGGVIAILGTLAFFAVHVMTLGMLPRMGAAWFAAPGILFLLAAYARKVSTRAM